MHEGHFTEDIVSAILTEVQKVPHASVQRVKVRVGEVYHLNTESVLAHYRIAVKGTPLESAALELEEVPVRLRCQDCFWEGPAEDHHLLFCTPCGGTSVTILSGKDITIDSIEMTTEHSHA